MHPACYNVRVDSCDDLRRLESQYRSPYGVALTRIFCNKSPTSSTLDGLMSGACPYLLQQPQLDVQELIRSTCFASQD